jgi:two-component sensor histidine kinase
VSAPESETQKVEYDLEHVAPGPGKRSSWQARTSVENSAGDEPLFGEHLLLRELTHRINNELAATIGFVNLSAARSGDENVKVALAGVIQHLTDSARIYRALQIPADDVWIDATAYLRDLCESISRTRLQYKSIELVFMECPLKLKASRCWRLGMIVSELITNASRHAFRDNGGTIQVELLNRGTFVECIVIDNGAGSENIRPGQGMKIIRSLLVDLRGTIDQRSGTRGTSVILSFPLRETGLNDSNACCLDCTFASPNESATKAEGHVAPKQRDYRDSE